MTKLIRANLINAFDAWLTPYDSVVGNYGHLLLEQKAPIDRALIDEMRPYFESAHRDARERFHNQIAISLHPDADPAAAPGIRRIALD